ncbi:MAG: alpha/beta fold hydrolase [Pseudomonadota bacterium]
MNEPLRESIPGPAGTLAIAIDLAPEPAGGCAVLAHPHPLYGGSMDDAVLGALKTPLQAAGLDVVRFNFRGVGGSTGTHDGAGGEADDVLAVLDWAAGSPWRPAQSTLDGPAPLLAGYSFGAAMAWAALCQAPGCARELWLIAPPIGLMAFEQRSTDRPLALWLGDGDAYCSTAHGEAFLAAVSGTAYAGEPQAMTVLPGADHFFAGQHTALAALAAARLQP